jgi:hypothetical protein
MAIYAVPVELRQGTLNSDHVERATLGRIARKSEPRPEPLVALAGTEQDLLGSDTKAVFALNERRF